MNTPQRFIASLFLTAALVAPVAVVAAAPQAVSVRVYDSGHKDYHNWDANEDRSWNLYLTENHRPEHTYAKSNKTEQSEYWNWRHDHPDEKK